MKGNITLDISIRQSRWNPVRKWLAVLAVRRHFHRTGHGHYGVSAFGGDAFIVYCDKPDCPWARVLATYQTYIAWPGCKRKLLKVAR